MASALRSFIGGGNVPWLMYGTGVVIVLLVELVGISGLAFALGMYLPMWLNTPILVGAVVAALVKNSTKDEKLSKARSDKGILIASGFIAGGAIIGVIISMLTALDDKLKSVEIMQALDFSEHLSENFENWLGLIMFLLLCVFAYWDSCRAKPELGAGELG